MGYQKYRQAKKKTEREEKSWNDRNIDKRKSQIHQQTKHRIRIMQVGELQLKCTPQLQVIQLFTHLAADKRYRCRCRCRWRRRYSCSNSYNYCYRYRQSCSCTSRAIHSIICGCRYFYVPPSNMHCHRGATIYAPQRRAHANKRQQGASGGGGRDRCSEEVSAG